MLFALFVFQSSVVDSVPAHMTHSLRQHKPEGG